MIFARAAAPFLLVLSAAASPVPVANPQSRNPSSIARRSLEADMLSAHNQYRAAHRAPPLVWDASLAEFAQNTANKCQFEHTPDNSYGENLAAGYSDTQEAVREWEAEESQYDYDSPGFDEDTGHFTQVVWKASRRMGCAQQSCPDLLEQGVTQTLWVCEYDPPGNMEGEFQDNVLP